MFYGSIFESEVSSVLEELCDALPSIQTCLIRSVDSARSAEDILKACRFHSIEPHVLGENVFLDKCQIHDALNAGLFTGFDEVWLLDREATPVDLSSALSSTSDGCVFSEKGLPDDIKKGMTIAHCCLLLADGCGLLNYACREQQIEEKIKRLSG